MKIYQNDEYLINPGYLKEQIRSRIEDDYEELDIKIYDYGIINSLGNGYGNWIVRLDIGITGGGFGGREKNIEYYLTHNNEDWFLSKEAREAACISDDEEAADQALQAAYEAVIDHNIERIVWDIECFIEDLKEDE